VKREGFPEFLKRQGLPIAIETRPGVVAFGPPTGAVAAFAAALDSGFQNTGLYARIAQRYREGAGLLLCADLARLPSPPQQLNGVRYIIAEQKEFNHQMEASATVGFDGARTGIAAWLAEPSPMGALDYVSPDATLVTAFVVKNPADIVDQTLALAQRSPAAADKALADARQQAGFDVRSDLAASLGGEFAVALDGPAFPVPSWKLVAEVYDPAASKPPCRKWRRRTNCAPRKRPRRPHLVHDRRRRPQPADGGALHFRRWLPDRRAYAGAGGPRAPGEGRRHLDCALRQVPFHGAARWPRQLLRRRLSGPGHHAGPAGRASGGIWPRGGPLRARPADPDLGNLKPASSPPTASRTGLP